MHAPLGMVALHAMRYASTPSINQPQQPTDAPLHETIKQASYHFSAHASYLGSDIDLHSHSHDPLLSSRCLLSSRDFAVFTLKPIASNKLSLPSPSPSPSPSPPSPSTAAEQPSGPGSSLGAAEDEEMLLEEAKEFGVMVAFKFGSVVTVVPRRGDGGGAESSSLLSSSSASAAEERMACELLQGNLASIIRPKKGVAPLLSDCIGSEVAHLVVRPSMKKYFLREKDSVVVPILDIENLEIICRVLGQSAALDFYTRATEQQVEALDAVLSELATNAGKPFWQRPFLFRRLRGGRLLSRIASSSIVYNKVVSRLGLLDTSRTAWESHEHDIVWQGLRAEYELMERFENLLKRLDIFKEESRFILDVRNERAGTVAEVTIIVLIAVEIIIQIYTHFIQG